MRLSIVLVAVLLASAAAADAALGQAGNGLYEPFPAPAARGAARKDVSDFGIQLSRKSLEQGRSVHRAGGPPPTVRVEPASSGPANTGAGLRESNEGGGTLLVAVLAAGAAA